MTREIKFRARIVEGGKPKMFYQESQYLISFLRRVASFLYFNKDDTGQVDEFNGGVHEGYLKEYELEKSLDIYIWEKDVNGKEIYTGDIVKAHFFYFDGNFDADGEIVGEIVIGTDGVGISNEKKEKFMFIRDTTHSEEPCIEIIGNMHENPELLK